MSSQKSVVCRFAGAILLWLVCLQAGCNIRPEGGPPGTINYQRHRAVIHDPFPSRFIGPEIEGARPMQYDRPLDQATGQQTNPYANRGVRGF
jgi:hypothetical protein